MSGPLGSSQWFKPKQFYSHTIEQSARFDSGSSAVLSRTPGTTGNRRTWTWSGWVKRSVLGSSQNFYTLFSAGPYTGSSTHFAFYYSGSKIDIISFYQYTGGYEIFYETNQLFKDSSAWYHFVVEVDITESTSTDRVKIYLNGTRITSFQTSTAPSTDTLDTYLNWTGATHYVGSSSRASTDNLSGYLAEVNFIDGTALDADSFGETKSGIWVPKDTSGLTFGTNGYRLKFQDDSSIGDNTGGNTLSPAFTVGGLVANDVVLDSPTNNWCTINSVGSLGTQSEGNLKTVTTSSGYGSAVGSMGQISGKWYWEVLPVSNVAGAPLIGVVDETYNSLNSGNAVGYLVGNDGVDSIAYYTNGSSYINGTANSSYGASYSGDDIIGVALNLDDNEITFYKNNSSQGAISHTFSGNYILPAVSDGSGSASQTFAFNFGQDSSFSNNKTSGSAAASDDNDIGDFYYTPPSGFLALCSANLPDPGIDPNKGEELSDFFNTAIYAGDSNTTKNVTVGFKPDWTWIKSRSNTNGHHSLIDSVRGNLSSNAKALNSNQTINEYSVAPFNANSNGTIDVPHYATDYSMNDSSYTYVAWNWLAGGESPEKTYKVVVFNDSGSNKYRFRNSADTATFAASAVTLELQEGGTYTFDVSDSTVNSHPFVIGTSANSSEYSTGVTYVLDGVTKTYSEYTSGFSSATSRQLIITVAASAPTLYYWCSVHSGMGGQINTNVTTGSSNFDGAIASTVSANTKAGFSIAGFTSTGAASVVTTGHGLSNTPEMLIFKNRTQTSTLWFVYHKDLTNNAQYYLQLSEVNKEYNTSAAFFSVDSTTAGIRQSSLASTGDNCILYSFHSVDGYSKVGTYVGNNATTFVYTGFKPAFLLIKSIDEGTGANWGMFDNTRPDGTGGTSGVKFLQADITNSEGASATVSCFFLSNGFEIGTSNLMSNASGDNFIYLAFAEQPFKYSNAE